MDRILEWIGKIFFSKEKELKDDIVNILGDDWSYPSVNYSVLNVPINFVEHTPMPVKKVAAALKSRGVSNVSEKEINRLYKTWLIYNDVKHLPENKIYDLFHKKITEYYNYINKRTPLIGQRAYKTERLTEGEGCFSDYPYRLYETSQLTHTNYHEIQKSIDKSFKNIK